MITLYQRSADEIEIAIKRGGKIWRKSITADEAITLSRMLLSFASSQQSPPYWNL